MVLGLLATLVVTFTATVNVNAQCTLICNDLVNVSLAEDCSLTLLPDMILEGGGCPNGILVVEVDRVAPFGNGPWVTGVLTSADLNKTFAVRVRNTATPNGNTCWGMIHVEDKLAPTILCADITISCAITEYSPSDLEDLGFAQAYPDASDNCYTPTLSFTDQFFDLPCGSQGDLSARAVRTWTAVDGSGNSATCQQDIYFERRHPDDVDFPEDVTIYCDESYPVDADGHPSSSLTGAPYILDFGVNVPIFPNNSFCEINATYTDQLITVCEGTRKYLRTWTVYDWCIPTGAGNPLYHIQLIKILDDQGPEIACPSDMVASTNPNQCCATVNLPDVIIDDNCSRISSISAMVVAYDQYLPDQVIGTYNITGNTLSTFPGNNFWDRDTLGRYGTTPCLPIGTHTVIYMAQDACGNTSSCSFQLTVLDDIAPVATCTQFTTVAIGTDDPTDCYVPSANCEFAGVTWVPASAFDQGSHDNCNGVEFTIRRMPEGDGTYSDCIDGLSPLCDGYEYNVATTENDSIKFYCCEVGTTQTVILRVYQVDINGNRDYYRNDDGSPLTDPDGVIQYIYNECMINVEVQDKIKPTCQPPAHVTVNCENFDPTLWAYGYPIISDNCCLDQTPPTSANPQGQTGIPAGTTAVPNVCGATQKTYYNNFLNANFDTTCNRGIIIRRFTAWDCQGFSSSCTQRVTVTNTQAYTVQFPADKLVNCVTAPDFGKPIITNDEGCELVGTAYNDVVFTVVPDACYKIERTWTIINWCTYLPDNPCTAITRNAVNPVTGLAPSKTVNVTAENCITYKQIIKVIDQTPPTVACQDIDTCDLSTNNVRYWNDGLNWWDNGTMQHDLCEKETEIAVTATDFCDTLSPTGGLRFRYLLFLDLDGDGIMETVVSSADLATRPLGQVLYGNATTPLYHGGTPWFFDNTSNANQRYRFDIEQTANGAKVIWRNASGTKLPELAHGRHKIKWIAEDGCGNEAVCEKTFTIKDCKPPVVACANVNINLMVGGMATLWATDFFLYGDDNCTPTNILNPTLAVIRADENPGNTYPGSAPANQSVVVTCDDEGTNVPVQVWLQDAAGNADFCIAYVNVQANVVGCDGNTPSATVAGALATENTLSIDQVSVGFNIAPNMNNTQVVDGNYAFSNVPMGTNVTVTPAKDNDPLNGVTTYDLVLISKHILGLEPLTTPYKMIAADANRSGSITTFDIVEFRKLILGIYEELPGNTSWRFVNKAYSFPSPSNPFQTTFPENLSISNLAASQMNADFVGVKIGDVNNSVTPNSLLSAESRTAGTLVFDVNAASQSVKAGEEVVVNFKAAEKMLGYQFTMNFDGLEVVEVMPGANMTKDNFGVFSDAITTSAEGDATEFAVKFRAVKAGDISRMLNVSSRITKAEAYTAGGERNEVAFRFEGSTGVVIGTGFELYQNQPNPVVGKTSISFNLPESADATLKITTVEGRVVKMVKGAFAKGLNTVTLNRSDLESGILFYELSTSNNSAVKKMIIVD